MPSAVYFPFSVTLPLVCYLNYLLRRIYVKIEICSPPSFQTHPLQAKSLPKSPHAYSRFGLSLGHRWINRRKILGHNEQKAYASKDCLYETVLLFNGKKVRHYGLRDHKEYFAEGTEAYFYHNDFYPFVRAELKEHDPALHELLVEIWGPLQ